jgi:predicted nucleic acid-binding protein
VIVIVNSGPVMALGKLGLLELLTRLYGQVRLPTAVYTEVVVRGSEKGTLGVIVQAYRAKLLRFDEVRTLVEAIIARDDIWIAEGLCRKVLAKLEAERADKHNV